jgi:hypothetical protein
MDKYLHLLEKKSLLVVDVNFEKRQNIIRLTGLKVMLFADYKQSLCTSMYLKTNSSRFKTISSIFQPYNNGSNYVNKIILQYKGKNYLLPYYVRINKEILTKLNLHKIKYIF